MFDEGVCEPGEELNMPGNTFWWVLGISIFTIFFEVNVRLSYRLISELITPISKDIWLECLIFTIIAFDFLAYLYLRSAKYWMVTAEGLTTKDGPVVSFGNVEQIINEGDGYPSVAFTAGGRRKMRLREKEYAKLAKTTLNQWAIDGDKVKVTAGQPGQGLSIKYSPMGKFQTNRFDALSSLIGIITAILLIFARKSIDEWGYPLMGLISPWVFWEIFDSYYNRVRVLVEGDTIRIIVKNFPENSFRFGDVDKLERGMFQNRITTKSGEVFYLPQACIILPELIEEFRG